jgi:hypothetical protein
MTDQSSHDALRAEVAAVEADEEDRAEMQRVLTFMDEISTPWPEP